jgi:hypothetical protein
MRILSEAFSFTQLYPPVDVTHSNVHSLSGDDVFFDSWNKGYVIQSAMWNNSETWLFWITTRRVRLDCEVVASMLAA